MLEAIGVPPAALYGSQADKAAPLDLFNGQSARFAMQTLGTEWGRNFFGPDFWSRAWGAQVDAGTVLGGTPGEEWAGVIVADDVRFPSEVEAIRARGGIVIQLIRSEDDLKREPKHASEAFQFVPYDIRIVNDGTKRQLAAKLRRAIGAARKPKPVGSPPAGGAGRRRTKGPKVKPCPPGDVRLVTDGKVSKFVPIEAAE